MAVNHNTGAENLSVRDLVLARLPFIADTLVNTKLLSTFTLEVMYELEGCFKVSILPDGTINLARVGDETFYSVLMKSIIADIVAVYILILLGAGSQFNGIVAQIDTGILSKYLKKTKAGSVEVEYDQFDFKKGSSFTRLDTMSLIGAYKKSAVRRAHQLGCVIDICDDCSIALAALMSTNVGLPFLTTDCGCGC